MIKIPLKNGNTIVCGDGTVFEHGGCLQLLNKKGQEIIFYDISEWIETPEQVIGAFFKACSENRQERV